MALYVDCKIFRPDSWRNRYVYVDFRERLIPLVDHTAVVSVCVSLTWSESFRTHRLKKRNFDLSSAPTDQRANAAIICPTTLEVLLLLWIPDACCPLVAA